MGNQQISEIVFKELNEGKEDVVLDYIEKGLSINSVSNCGVSLFRASLEKGMPRLFEICYLNKAIMLPCLTLQQTPLHRAVYLNHYELVYFLLKHKYLFRRQINEQDALGKTALHIAIEVGDPNIVAVLLKFNANKKIKDYTQKTPYDIALESKKYYASEILDQISIKDRFLNTSKQPGDFCKNIQNSSQKNEIRDVKDMITDNHVVLIDKNELKITEIINKGSSCLVFKGTLNGDEVAIKKFTKNYSESPKVLRKILKEIITLSQIRHKNLLLMLGACIYEDTLCIVTELMPNYTLFDAIHKPKQKKLSLSERFHISIQLAKGISYLHNKQPPIIHRDLKPENCLLDYNLNLKICDFGLARNFKSNEEATTVCIGTTRFMAPELFDSTQKKNISIKIDIWALGCLLIEIFSDKRPWHYISSKKSNSIFYELYNKRPIPIPSNVPEEIMRVIKNCCNYNPSQRPCVDQVLECIEAASIHYT
jgi:Protein kinase domain/Ankyrin repeats (3 copies)